MKIKPRLIIGLGNPGSQYQKTYHNIGVSFIDCLKKMPPISNPKLLISKVFMNQSGGFIRTAIRKYGARPEELLIVHDDSDIELGKYKFSFGRSSAGHKGIQSIINSLDTKNFWRLRIGIRREASQTAAKSKHKDFCAAPRLKASEMVLKKINRQDAAILNQTIEQACLKLKQLF